MPRTVLVTGGSGFIGSFTCRRLAEAGFNVVIYDKAAPSHPALRGVQERITYVKGDLLDWHLLVSALKNSRAEYVVHLAAPLSDETEANPYTALRGGVEATLNVFEASYMQGVGRIVWASSLAVYGSCTECYPSQPLDESITPHPDTVYGATKLYLEHLSKIYRERRNLSIIALRFGVVTGPLRTRGPTALASLIVEEAARTGKIRVPVDPTVKIDWIYVLDAAEAILKAITADKPRLHAYNIVSARIELNDIIEALKETHPHLEITIPPNPVKPPLAAPSQGFSTTNAEKDLGWAPQWNLKNAVRNHIEWLSLLSTT